jgi:hypothetical protein
LALVGLPVAAILGQLNLAGENVARAPAPVESA